MDTPTLSMEERCQLAQKLFEEYYIRCFWSWREDLKITPEYISDVAKGLRHYGGHEGMRLAEKLCQ